MEELEGKKLQHCGAWLGFELVTTGFRVRVLTFWPL